MKRYELPQLPYAYSALEPYIIEEIMRLHHTKHHQAYVNGANAALEKIEKAAKGEIQIDVRAVLRDLSFNLDGHQLHSIFWPNMAPPGKGGGKPGGAIADKIDAEFGASRTSRSSSATPLRPSRVSDGPSCSTIRKSTGLC